MDLLIQVSRCARSNVVLLTLLGTFGFHGLATQARGQVYTLTDGNSRLEIDTSAQATGYDWIVDNVHHLAELSNWYRVGGSGPERSVHTLNVQPGTLSDTDFDGANDKVSVPYLDPLGRFRLEIDYAVVGGLPGSGFSAFDEEVRITNLQSVPLTFHFFEYVDLNLYESPNDDIVLLTSPNSLRQYDALTVSDWGFDVDRYELGVFNNTLQKLLDATASNLNDTWPSGTGPLGPADVTWALQWDFAGTFGPRPDIPPGQTAVITKTGQLQMSFIVPEPAGVAMLGWGIAGLLVKFRIRSK